MANADKTSARRRRPFREADRETEREREREQGLASRCARPRSRARGRSATERRPRSPDRVTSQWKGNRGRESVHARILHVSRPSSLARTTFILKTAMQLVSNILGRLAVAAAALVLVVRADDEVT